MWQRIKRRRIASRRWSSLCRTGSRSSRGCGLPSCAPDAASRAFDVFLALSVCAFDLSQLFDPSPGASPGQIAAGALLLASVSMPLLWRRQRPLTVLGIVTSVALAWFLIPYVAEPPLDHFNASFFAFVLSLYSAGLYATNKKASVIAALVALGSVLTAVAFLDEEFRGNPRAFFFNASIVIVFFYVGYIGRVRRDYLEEKAARLEREGEEEARRAVARERARIARELHDVIAHSVGLITVQAGAAHLVFGENPEAALSSLSSIERTGRLAWESYDASWEYYARRTKVELSTLSQVSTASTSSSRRWRRRESRSRSRSRVISETCRPPSGSLPTGSCRRVSPTC
ncbi:MAG: histidine kinase dimerization/phosphoacceptor domain-containing protein [Actinomycetota bacterium]